MVLKIIRKILFFPYWLWVIILFFTFLVSSTLLAILINFLYPGDRQKPLIGLYKCWSFLIMLCSGIVVRMHNRRILEGNLPCIMVANHSSNIDMFIGAYCLPLKTKPLAKVELKKIPLLGFLFSTVCVLIDRGSPESRQKGSRLLKEELRKKNTIFIYPEGTRNKGKKPLNPFYDGAFRFAIEGEVPLIAMCTINARNICPPDRLSIKPGFIDVYFIGPYDTKGLSIKDIPALKQKVYDDMQLVIGGKDSFYQKVLD